MPDRTKRSRILAIGLIAIVAWLEIHTRRYAPLLTATMGHHAADALWALDLFLGVGLLFPSGATGRVALGSFLLAVAVEFSHLYQALWIDALRATDLGLLVLGDGFHAASLVCYGAGVGFGMFAELLTLE